MFPETGAERGSASGTATEQAAVEQKSVSGTATEHASFASGTKETRLDRMFQEACANTSPKLQSLLQEVRTLGHYPKRFKQPATKYHLVAARKPRL